MHAIQAATRLILHRKFHALDSRCISNNWISYLQYGLSLYYVIANSLVLKNHSCIWKKEVENSCILNFFPYCMWEYPSHLIFPWTTARNFSWHSPYSQIFWTEENFFIVLFITLNIMSTAPVRSENFIIQSMKVV